MSEEEFKKELENLKDKIYEFKKFLDSESDHYAQSESAINIELSVTEEILDKFNEIFSPFDY